MTQMKRLFVLVALVATTHFHPALAADGAPKFIEYQGTVLDTAGAPLAPTTPRLYKMEFRLWDQLEAGTLIWSEQQFVNVSNGQFSVRLGEGQAIPTEPNDLTAAFAAKDRFIGLTVVNPSAAKSEISPRLAMLSAPYAVVANAASKVVQQPGSFSTMVAGSIAYSTLATSGSAAVSLTLDKRVNLIAASATGTTATLPVNGALQELVVIKTDNDTPFVTVVAPGGGKINVSASIRLKVKGESVTLQNVGGNDWWIVKDSRDTTPVGTIIAYGGENPPPGYLACDGAQPLRTAHSDLYVAIGNTWGPSTATTFRLPSLIGQFLRGINPGDAGADEDFGLRLALFPGGNSGLSVGSFQSSEVLKHSHTVADPGHVHTASMSVTGPLLPWAEYDGDGDGRSGFDSNNFGDGSNDFTMNFATDVKEAFTGITSTGLINSGPGAVESRPDNAGVRYCIKY